MPQCHARETGRSPSTGRRIRFAIDVTWPTASGPGVEKMTMMSKSFGAMMTDVKARIGTRIGSMRLPNAEQDETAAARARGAKNDRPRHPLSSFRDSVGQPIQQVRAGATSRPERIQGAGD